MHRFLISVAEHMVYVMGLLQWGKEWQSMGYTRAFYNTDNQNSASWVTKGFANNDIAQELSRLGAALQALYVVHILPLWWPTTANHMADMLSRMLDEAGNPKHSVVAEFETANAKLDKPYSIVTPNAQVHDLVDWVADMKTCFDELSPIRLRTATVMGLTRPMGRAISSMSEELKLWREAFTVQDAMDFCRSGSSSFTFAALGSGACIGTMGTLRTGHWMPRWASETVPYKQAMWEHLTCTPCYGCVTTLNATELEWVAMITITMPCIDYSSSGNKRGAKGDTGWLWLAAVKFAVQMSPYIIFSEMADNVIRVNGGTEYRQVLSILSTNYTVHSRIVRVWDYGDGS